VDEAFDVDALFEEYSEFGKRLEREGMLVDAGDFLARQIDDGRNVMFEGAQGTIIDIDHGTTRTSPRPIRRQAAPVPAPASARPSSVTATSSAS